MIIKRGTLHILPNGSVALSGYEWAEGGNALSNGLEAIKQAIEELLASLETGDVVAREPTASDG